MGEGGGEGGNEEVRGGNIGEYRMNLSTRRERAKQDGATNRLQ